jgi:addiction module RelE/StbE family toxin
MIEYHRIFLKHFENRLASNSSLVLKFKEKIKLLENDPNNPSLKSHNLSGSKKGFRSFSLTGDMRVVYKIEGRTIRLYDVGTHNQVY